MTSNTRESVPYLYPGLLRESKSPFREKESFSYLRVTGYQGPKCPVTQDACFHDLQTIKQFPVIIRYKECQKN